MTTHIPALFLTEAEVASLLDAKSAVDAVEESFRRLAAGDAQNVPRYRAAAGGITLHTMSAAAGYLGLVGHKAYTTTRSGARFLLSLYDQATGNLLAILEANRLGQLRTGAATAVAVEFLAAPDVHEMGLFGTGWQAEGQLEAVAEVRNLRQVFVYGRDHGRREDFAQRMAQQLEIEIVPVDRPQEAAEEVPLVITATSSREPVFDGSRLMAGTLVCAVGSNWWNKAEVDSHVVRLADNIVCDSIDACRHEAGDFRDAIERGIFHWGRAVDLCDVVAGRCVGRKTKSSIVLFKSVGMALEDLAVGKLVLDRARERGIGVPLPI
jgi:ornithine cyclodeaminase/alanine dehydrogenase-like protein (mu-crystallin family)